jgi:hypothetical protein
MLLVQRLKVDHNVSWSKSWADAYLQEGALASTTGAGYTISEDSLSLFGVLINILHVATNCTLRYVVIQ